MPRPRKTALATYSFRVREKFGRDHLLLGNQTFATSLWDEFRLFAGALQNLHQHDKEEQTLLHVLALNEVPPDVLWGTAHLGGYGQGRDVIDSETLKTVHRVAPNQAVMHPFYFMLHAPAGWKRALFITERQGAQGVHTSFVRMFREWLSLKYPHLILDVSRIIPLEVLEYLKRGSLRQIKYTTFTMPRELEEKVRLGGSVEGEIVVKMTVTARRGEAIAIPEWMRKAVESKTTSAGLLESAPVTTTRTEEEDVRLMFEYNGNQRTINLANPYTIAPYADVTAEVQFNADGHPKPESLHMAAMRLRDELLEQIKGS